MKKILFLLLMLLPLVAFNQTIVTKKYNSEYQKYCNADKDWNVTTCKEHFIEFEIVITEHFVYITNIENQIVTLYSIKYAGIKDNTTLYQSEDSVYEIIIGNHQYFLMLIFTDKVTKKTTVKYFYYH